MGLVVEIGKAAPSGETDGAAVAAAEAFAAAVKSGNGKKILETYGEMRACCEEMEMDEESDDDE